MKPLMFAALAALALAACESAPGAVPVWDDPAMADTFDKGGRDN